MEGYKDAKMIWMYLSGDNKGAYMKQQWLRPPAKQHLECFAKSITRAYNDDQVDHTFVH